MKGFLPIAGGYQYAPHRVGVSLMAPSGRIVYFQPGNDTAAFYETLDSLNEIPSGKRAIIADMAFGEYFA